MTMDKNTEQTPFTQLRAGNPGCPSDLALDRLQAGELSEDKARELRQHVADCTLCPERMSSRSIGFAGFKEVDERKILSAIRSQLADSPPASMFERFLQRLRIMAVPLSAAAMAAVVGILLLGRSGGSSDPNPVGSDTPMLQETREKGGLALQVYRLVGGQAQPALSGDTFRQGERLRFVVDLPAAGQVAVLGVEPGGGLYVAWPQSPGDGPRSLGKRQELPGAVALDGSVGTEVLYLVLCPSDGKAPAESCKAAGAGLPPSCPVGCRLTPFVMNKQ
jgi:hypothetical protein